MANEHFGVIGASSAVDRRGGGQQSGGKEKRKAQRVEKSRVEVIVRHKTRGAQATVPIRWTNCFNGRAS